MSNPPKNMYRFSTLFPCLPFLGCSSTRWYVSQLLQLINSSFGTEFYAHEWLSNWIEAGRWVKWKRCIPNSVTGRCLLTLDSQSAAAHCRVSADLNQDTSLHRRQGSAGTDRAVRPASEPPQPKLRLERAERSFCRGAGKSAPASLGVRTLSPISRNNQSKLRHKNVKIKIDIIYNSKSVVK